MTMRICSTAKKITSSAVVTTAGKSGILYAITLRCGTTDSTALLMNGGTSGTEVWGLALNGETAVGETTTSITFNPGIIFTTDIFCNMAGTGAIAHIQYEEIED